MGVDSPAAGASGTADPFASASHGRLIDGRYRILRRVCTGETSVVFLAEDVMLERVAALKMIEPALALNPSVIERFRHEAQTLARLRHQNVVSVYSFGQAEGTYFFVMEYVEGDTLEDFIESYRARGENVPVDVALEMITAIAMGLTAAHDRGLVHRDIKPANILIERGSNRPVLIDFSVAMPSSSNSKAAAAAAAAVVNAESIDVNAFAATAYELLDDQDALFAQAFHHAPSGSTAMDLVRALTDAAIQSGLVGAPSDGERDLLAVTSSLLVLADDTGARRAIVREVMTRSIEQHTDSPHQAHGVECVETPGALLAAYMQTPARLVVIDDDHVHGNAVSLALQLRSLRGGHETEILILSRDKPIPTARAWDSAARVHRMNKPLNLRMLGARIEQMLGTPDTPSPT